MVNPNGSKLWRLAYRSEGKQKLLSGGPYPAVSLADPRAWRDDSKGLLAKGIDPSAERQKEQRRKSLAASNDFETIARQWHESRRSRWSERYARITLGRLAADVFPMIGRMPVGEIEPQDVLSVIRNVEGRGWIDSARRLDNTIGEIFGYAVALGSASRDPTRDILVALKDKPPVRHHPSLEKKNLLEFFGRLERSPAEPMTKLAIRFTFYTLVRTQETVFASWDEFEALDDDRPLWRIPAGRMKMRSPHLVPLAPQVVNILNEARALDPHNRFVVSSSRGGAMNTETMRMAMKRMGYKGLATPHGFRSTGSTILIESGLFQFDWIETALAHQERNSVRAAYNSAKYLNQRRDMMRWWANYLDDYEAVARAL